MQDLYWELLFWLEICRLMGEIYMVAPVRLTQFILIVVYDV